MAGDTLSWIVLIAIALFVVWMIFWDKKEHHHEGFIRSENALTSPFKNLRPEYYCSQFPDDPFCQDLADCSGKADQYKMYNSEPSSMQSWDYNAAMAPPSSPSQMLRESPFN